MQQNWYAFHYSLHVELLCYQACRTIGLSHVLITNCGARIRVGGVGVLDALENIACSAQLRSKFIVVGDEKRC